MVPEYRESLFLFLGICKWDRTERNLFLEWANGHVPWMRKWSDSADDWTFEGSCPWDYNPPHDWWECTCPHGCCPQPKLTKFNTLLDCQLGSSGSWLGYDCSPIFSRLRSYWKVSVLSIPHSWKDSEPFSGVKGQTFSGFQNISLLWSDYVLSPQKFI